MRTLRLGVTTLLVRTILHISAVACVLLCACGFASCTNLPSNSKYATPLACIKILPDGAHVVLDQKVVTCIMGNILYVEEPDRSAGIRVVMGSGLYIPLNLCRGNFVSFSGHMSTVNNERAVVTESDLQCDFTPSAIISPIGMNTAAIMGWPIYYKQPYGPRMTGLIPKGLYVRLWGKITMPSTFDTDSNIFIYMDDGWDKFDGSDMNAKGIRVYTGNTSSVGDVICANGVLSYKKYDPSPTKDGDEILIPCVLTTVESEVAPPETTSTARIYASVSGRVRLVGEQTGKDVRIYSEKNSIILNNVKDQWTSFTLAKVPNGGTPVSASAQGYRSATKIVNISDTSVDFELQPSDTYTEILTDKDSIAVCSSDTAHIVGMRRDCEGKGLEGLQLRLTTTSGIFLESNSREFIGTTDSTGCVNAHLNVGNDGPGIAVVKAETYPSADQSSSLNIEFKGPIANITASPKILESAGSSSISAHIEINNSPLTNVPLTFITQKGTFAENGLQSYTALSDANGDAHASLELSSPGTTKVTVEYEDRCSNKAIDWTAVSYVEQPWFAQQIKYSHPLVVDLDGNADGKKEVAVVTGEGYLVALDTSGNQLWSKGPFRADNSYGNTSPSCAPMDSERSGRPCVFLPTENPKAVYAFSYNGHPLAGWPTSTRFSFFDMACSIGDINLDGSPEIVCGDQCCYVWSWNPTGNWTASADTDAPCLWVNLTGNSNTVIHSSTCALGDMNNDENGILDVVMGTITSPGNLFGFPGDAWGIFTTSGYNLENWPKTGGGQIETAPAIGDIDGDGKNDVAWGAGDGNLHILLSSTDSQIIISLGLAVKSSPALADLDGDGKLDVVVGSNTGNIYAYNYLGQLISGWEDGICVDPDGNKPIEAPISIADVNGDGEPEVVTVCDNGFAYALYADGKNHTIGGECVGPVAWVGCCTNSSTAKFNSYSAPVIDDLDNDGLVDILIAGSQGIYVYHLNAAYSGSPSAYPWPTFHHDNRRSGCMTAVPSPVSASIQGIISHNGTPISGAKIYIYKNDGSTVYVPHSSPLAARSYVLSVGSSDADAVGVGAYCINQLEPNQTYKIRIDANGFATKWVTNIAVTTGLARVDVEL